MRIFQVLVKKSERDSKKFGDTPKLVLPSLTLVLSRLWCTARGQKRSAPIRLSDVSKMRQLELNLMNSRNLETGNKKAWRKETSCNQAYSSKNF